MTSLVVSSYSSCLSRPMYRTASSMGPVLVKVYTGSIAFPVASPSASGQPLKSLQAASTPPATRNIQTGLSMIHFSCRQEFILAYIELCIFAIIHTVGMSDANKIQYLIQDTCIYQVFTNEGGFLLFTRKSPP